MSNHQPNPQAVKLAKQVIGMDKVKAFELIQKAGFLMRIIAEDWNVDKRATGFNPNRIKLSIEWGKITEAVVG